MTGPKRAVHAQPDHGHPLPDPGPHGGDPDPHGGDPGPHGGDPDPHGGDPSPAPQRRRLVTALAITQTVGYGALYYAFAVLLHPMAASLHASVATLTGALTVSILAGALMSVPVGRWLDHHGGHTLMTAGSATATLLLAAWSQVHTVPQLYAVLTGIGLTSSMVLYEPAFAVTIANIDAARRAGALLAITVVAGFASSIFLPLTGLLVDRYGWRTALLILAAIHGALTIPLHAWAVPRRSAQPPRHPAKPGNRTRDPVRFALRDTGFWVLAVVFVAHATAVATITVHLIGYLTSRGHSPGFAATVAGLFGILSVTGRLVLTGAQRRIRMATIVAVIFALQAAAVPALVVFGGTAVGAILAVTGFGLGFGVATLARPALLADRYGTASYATIAGLLNLPVTVAKAGAPLAAALLLRATHQYTAVLIAVAVACAVAATGMLISGRAPTRVPACRPLRVPTRVTEDPNPPPRARRA